MNNTYFLSTNRDDWIEEYREGNPIWIATLDDGMTVFRDDGRWKDSHWSAWKRLYDYCAVSGRYIVSFRFGFRSNMYSLLDNQEGYYFSLSCRAYPTSQDKERPTLQLWKLGILRGNTVNITKYLVPEFLFDENETKDIGECSLYQLIKKPCLNQKLIHPCTGLTTL